MKYDEIEKNNIYNDYIINNLTQVQMCEKYNLTKKQFNTRLKFYDIHKEKKQHITKEELVKYYITENKTIEEIEQEHNIPYNEIRYLIKIYGIKKDQELIQKCREKSNLEKYGVINTGWLPETQEKIKKTCQEKFNSDSPLGSQIIKDKIKQTNIERYGVVSNFFNKEVRERIKQTCLEKYGVEYACLSDNCIKSMVTKNSKPNLEFENILYDLNISYEREVRISRYSYDFKINNIMVEINPSATHNSTFGVYGKEPMSETYHLDKLNLAKENGFRCVHVFDWDDERKIVNMFINKEKIYARKCEIREVPLEETCTFLNEHHLQGNCKGQKIRIGLYYNNELVELMTFGNPRYNKKYEYELLRLCTDNKYSVIGGASKLYTYFIKTYNPQSVISYCDNSKFDGSVYKNLGFKLDSFGRPSKHWYNLRNGKHITDNLLRQRGYDQLFGGEYGKGTSNEELMIQNNFVEIYDCGQSVYTYKREE